MVEVGVRELKSQLSQYLSQVKRGETVVVTERGMRIAVIMPTSPQNAEESAKRLVALGLAHWGGGKPQGSPRPIRIRGKPLSETVLEDRR